MHAARKRQWALQTYWVVCRQPDWLVGGKVCQVYPVPRCDQHILAFDVSMTDTTLMALGQGMQQLKGYPMLHFSTYVDMSCMSMHNLRPACADEAYMLLACV